MYLELALQATEGVEHIEHVLKVKRPLVTTPVIQDVHESVVLNIQRPSGVVSLDDVRVATRVALYLKKRLFHLDALFVLDGNGSPSP